MRPTEKRSLTLKPSERNPYANRTEQSNLNEEEEQDSEEVAIRAKLGALQVTGSSRSTSGLILLLGDIMIQRGKVLPQLILNQTQELKVVGIDEEKIVLGWMDVETGELTGKTMQLPYDLRPNVNYVLKGQSITTETLAKDLDMGVLKPKRKGPPGKGGAEGFARRGR